MNETKTLQYSILKGDTSQIYRQDDLAVTISPLGPTAEPNSPMAEIAAETGEVTHLP